MNLKERLHNHLIQIVRDRNPYLACAGHFYVQHIREQLAQWGNVEIDDFSVRGQVHHNLILNLPPVNSPLSKGEREDNPGLEKRIKKGLPTILMLITIQYRVVRGRMIMLRELLFCWSWQGRSHFNPSNIQCN
jgi:hypothetical protein